MHVKKCICLRKCRQVHMERQVCLPIDEDTRSSLTLQRVLLMPNGLSKAGVSQSILISDSGCNQMLVTSIWCIISHSRRSVTMNGAFASCGHSQLLPVVSPAAKVIDEQGHIYAAIAHEVLYDDNPLQFESLLSTHQSLSNPSNAIDDQACCEQDICGNPGTQSACFNDKNLSLHFDGCKCFFEVAAISEEELRTPPCVYLNSQENTPYELSVRTNTIRTITKNFHPHEAPWKHHLGFIPDLVVQKTLKATTQFVPMVEAKCRKHMQDHILARLPELKHWRINDTACCDTFFSSIPSVRGFTCWTQYSFLHSGLDRVYLMQQRSQYLPTLQRMLVDCGVPHTIHSDNAPEFKSDRWTKLMQIYLIKNTYTEAYHHNQNLCERPGGVLKVATSHLLLVTGAPLEFWCCLGIYCVASVCYCPSEFELGISSYSPPRQYSRHQRFSLWVLVSRMVLCSQQLSFPNSKMLPRRFIGIACNVGDAFCILIVRHDDNPDEHKVIAQSVVRRQYPQEVPPTLDDREYNSLKFYKNDGKTILVDPVDDSGFSLSNHLLPEKSISHSLPDMVNSSADKDDPLRDTIAEVYGPPRKRQRVEFTDPVVVAAVDVDPVVSPPRPSSPQPPSKDSSQPRAQTKIPDVLPAHMTPASPVLGLWR